MIFSSPAFFLFFSIYLLLHLVVPPTYRLALLIGGSTVFYGYWNPWYIWLPFALVLVAFYGAIWFERERGTTSHGCRLAVIVGALLAPLIVIKYTNFFYQDVLGFNGRLVNWAFPLGISFITFTVIAYVVDVYRGCYPLEKRLRRLLGLVLFFPHLIAGPILRPRDLLPQLGRLKPAWSHFGIRFVYGLAIFTLGLFKKIVIADTLAEAVNTVYAGTTLSSADYVLAWYGFSVQIYCDFSGYTDMAIGVAIIIGVRLPINFSQPFTSRSIIEFWRRWHITLSTWLRDYLYITLGGNRDGLARQVRNVLITMTLGGLWHGANWTFLIWGLLHGLAISVNHLLNKMPGPEMPSWFKALLTFHFVCSTFIIFRAPDFAAAWQVMSGPFVAPLGNLSVFTSVHAFELLLLGLFFATHSYDDHRFIRRLVRRSTAVIFWPTIVLIWSLCIAMLPPNAPKFIYFDF